MNMSYIRIHLLTLRNYCKNIVLKFLDKPWGHCLKLHEGALRYLGFLESIRSNRWAELFQMLTRVLILLALALIQEATLVKDTQGRDLIYFTIETMWGG